MWVSSKAGSYRPRETIALLVELYVYKYSTWTFQKLDSAKRKISRQTGGMYLEINQTSFAWFFTASTRKRRIPDAITNSRLRVSRILRLESRISGLPNTNMSTNEGGPLRRSHHGANCTTLPPIWVDTCITSN